MALERAQAEELLAQLDSDWHIGENGYFFLEKTYRFKDFADALAFVNRVGALAEEQGHHPDIHLAWGRVKLQIWTHRINGLTQNDFHLAAQCDRL